VLKTGAVFSTMNCFVSAAFDMLKIKRCNKDNKNKPTGLFLVKISCLLINDEVMLIGISASFNLIFLIIIYLH